MKGVKLEKDWIVLLKEWEDSGMTKSGWCRSKGISLDSFNYWNNKLNKSTTDGNDVSVAKGGKTNQQWVPVNVDNDLVVKQKEITILINDIKIIVNKGFDSELLKDIVKVLSCC